MIEDSVESYLEDTFAAKIVSCSQVSGGSINRAYQVSLENSQSLFLKLNSRLPQSFFFAERDGLEELRKASILAVPKVLHCPEFSIGGVSLLALEWLAPAPRTHKREERFARELAALHSTRFSQFGFHADNYIGENVQKNSWSDSWAEFFLTERIDFQAELGRANGWFGLELSQRFESARVKIEEALSSLSIYPSLLHGDLWGGNVHWTEEGAYLIDPATYYGHFEADIAFTEMFGGFSESFYKAYSEVLLLESDYDTRKEIYNLYHIMNHANQFGGSYIDSVDSVLNRFS